MPMPGRYKPPQSGDDYRFGFQGQEKNNDISGTDGGHLYFKYRIHDARLGRFLSVDPLAANFSWNSPYSFSENKVIRYIELEGAESYDYMDKIEHEEGETKLQYVKNWTLNRLISISNIVPAINNTITTFLWEGPEGVIEDYNEGLNDMSYAIAEDMIEAKQSGEVKTGVGYVVDRGKDPEVWGDIAVALAFRRIAKSYRIANANGVKPSVPKITTRSYKINSGKEFVSNNMTQLEKKLGSKIGQGRLPFEKSKTGVEKALQKIEATIDDNSKISNSFTNSNGQLMQDIYSEKTGFTVRVAADSGEFNTLIEGATDYVK